MRAILLAIALATTGAIAHDAPSVLHEMRYCGAPARTASGEIRRRADVLAAFRRVHPCPATGSTTGACPGWAINHAIPLACGGCDAVWNLQWMRSDVKRLHDGYERQINAAEPPIPGTERGCRRRVQL